MIHGIGTDIVSINRIATIYSAHPVRFLSKLLSQIELSHFHLINNFDKKILYLAGRWAAKEAVVKALGTGFRHGLYLNQISIINNQSGQPNVLFSDSVKDNLSSLLGLANIPTKFFIHLSLAHEVEYATSMAILELR